MHKVNSSNIHSIGYNDEHRELHVRFDSGARYVYHDVPDSVFTKFRMAESKMKFLNAEVKGKFNFRRA